MFDVGIGAAFLAGLLSFVSPCVLPIVPPSLAYIAGVSFAQLESDAGRANRRVVLAAVFFVLGFTTVFIALGATANVIGQRIAQYFDVLAIVAGALIIFMGLHFIGVFRLAFLYRDTRVEVRRKPPGLLGAFVMGLAFAFGWSPCVGPVLTMILFVAGAEETALRGAGLLGVYSLGIGLPFIVAALFAPRFLNWSYRVKKYMRAIEVAIGCLLILTGILFMTGSMRFIAEWLLNTFSVFKSIG